MKHIQYTIPKETFEYIFEQIKHFYNVTSWCDFGIEVCELRYLDENLCLPDNVNLYIYKPDLYTIFEDRLMQRFLHKAGFSEVELNNVCLILKGICAIHLTFSGTVDMSDEELYENDREEYFKHMLETELRKLHKFCCEIIENSEKGSKTTIETARGNKIVLGNFSNYIFRSALKKYCEDHVPDLKGKTYTKQEFIDKNKGGRRPESNYITGLIYGTYLMLKSFTKENVDISEGICRIIYRFLEYLDIDTYSMIAEKDAIKIIRARIKALQKKSYKPNIGRIREYRGEDAKRFFQNSGLGLYNDL